MAFDLATLWTILPVRGLAAGKSRLAPVLSPAQRAALNHDLLLRTLTVLDTWSGSLRRCIVVSPCRDALSIAREAGAARLREGASAGGLIRAVELGVARAAASGATHALILPCDLPFLSEEALAALEASALGGAPVVLAPDRLGTGTNALLSTLGTGFEYSFGPKSFAAHRAAARRAGLRAAVVHHPDLEFDLDTPADHASWLRGRPANMRPGVHVFEEES